VLKDVGMLKLEDNRRFSKEFVWFIWLLMAFQAGYVNVGAFYTSGYFVSHVTGTSSNIGIGFAKLDIMFLLNFLTVLVAFIGGATFSGYFIGVRERMNLKPKYVFITFVKCLLFFLVLMLAELNYFNHFPSLEGLTNTLIIFILSFCCGVQNSTCSQATNGFLKPTHMTGLSTTVGINIAKNLPFGKNKKYVNKKEVQENNLRLGILFSFIFGGFIASAIFSVNGHYGFLFPFLCSFSLFCLGLVHENEKVLENHIFIKTAKVTLMTILLATLFIGINGNNISQGVL